MVCTRTRCVCVRSDEQTCKEVCLARLSCVLLIWHAVSSPLAITCTADVSSSESVRAVAFCFVALCIDLHFQAADKERSRVQSLVDEASRENVAQESNGSEALVCVLLKDDIHTRVLPVFASLHE